MGWFEVGSHVITKPSYHEVAIIVGTSEKSMYITTLPDSMSASDVILLAAKTWRCACLLRIWLITYLCVRQSKGYADMRNVIIAVLVNWPPVCFMYTP